MKPILDKYISDSGPAVEELIKGLKLASAATSLKDKLILAADGKPVCWLCKQRIYLDEPFDSDACFSVDHVLKDENGGQRNFDNCRPSHKLCNNTRHSPKTDRVRKRMKLLAEHLARKGEKLCS